MVTKIEPCLCFNESTLLYLCYIDLKFWKNETAEALFTLRRLTRAQPRLSEPRLNPDSIHFRLHLSRMFGKCKRRSGLNQQRKLL